VEGIFSSPLQCVKSTNMDNDQQETHHKLWASKGLKEEPEALGRNHNL